MVKLLLSLIYNKCYFKPSIFAVNNKEQISNTASCCICIKKEFSLLLKYPSLTSSLQPSLELPLRTGIKSF